MHTPTFAWVSLALLLVTSAQSPGRGISKTTMACNNPIAGKQFIEKYFPVATPGDECANDVCSCGTWDIEQGRVYALESDSSTGNSSLGAPAGNGFGMHLVNVSNSRTTGGMSVAEVEEEFTSKLGDMSRFDSFMDYNAMFYTTGLAAYHAAFAADSVPVYVTTWTYNSKTWTSVFVHVPNSQLTIELCQDTTLGVSSDYQGTPRASAAALDAMLAKVQPLSESSTGAIISPLAVNRAASAASMAKLEDFYLNGMGTTLSANESTAEYSRKCFRWQGATVDVCFYLRPDSQTKGSFTVLKFEQMLNTVHQNIIAKHPYCARDKWTDNHYAIDSFSANTESIANYINQNDVYVFCEGSTPHYAIDPTGWGIQLDLQFSSTVNACSSSSKSSRSLLQHTNPACSDGTCA